MARSITSIGQKQRSGTAPDRRQPLRFGDIEVDLVARTVRYQGVDPHVGVIGHFLLDYLARNPGVVLTHDQLLDHLDARGKEGRTVESLGYVIRRLRHKLGRHHPRGGGQIVACYVGYKLTPFKEASHGSYFTRPTDP